MGLFLTPEESSRPRVLALLDENLKRLQAADAALDSGPVYRTVQDPGVSSLHLALLPQRQVRKRQRHQLRALLYQLIEEGPEKLTGPERRSLISDAESLSRLHVLSWSEKQT